MDIIAAEFGEDQSLYDVLGIQASATTSEIKKAYYQQALRCHPDKCPGDEAAKGRFQALSSVHSTLSDPERRSLYDETGEVVEEGNDGSTEEGDVWYNYWRNLFPKITVADITSFSNKYQGSQEETKDVLEAYKICKGKMLGIIDSIMLATEADENRFRAIIDLAVERKEAPIFAAFRKASGGKTAGASNTAAKRKAKMEKEAAEAEKLVATIKGRHKERMDASSVSTHRVNQFNSMVSSLEERYGGDKASNSARKKKGQEGKRAKISTPPDIDDDEFERIQQRLGKGKARSKR